MSNKVNSALINAIALGDLKDVQARGKRDINAEFFGWTPLHWAALHGHVLPQEGKDDTRIVEALLHNGACPNAKDWHDNLPVDIAREQGYSKIVRVLEEAEKAK